MELAPSSAAYAERGAINRRLYEDTFLLNYLRQRLSPDRNQGNVDRQNMNYIPCFKDVYKQYLSEKRAEGARELKQLSLLLAGRTGKKEYVEWVEKEFQ